MQTLSLNFYQRFMLWNLIGAYEVPKLKETDVYLRVIAKIRLSDEEKTVSEFVSDGERTSWRLPERDYGTKAVELEKDEVKAFIDVLEQSPLRVADSEWRKELIGSLNGAARADNAQPASAVAKA